MTSQVDHPDHYGGADDPYEAIKVMRAWATPQEYAGFLKLSALKYMRRHRDKDGDVDLRKARWYLDEMIAFLADSGGQAEVYPSPTYWVVDPDGSVIEYDDLDQCVADNAQTREPLCVHASVPFADGTHARWFLRYQTSDDEAADVDDFAQRTDAEAFLASEAAPTPKAMRGRGKPRRKGDAS